MVVIRLSRTGAKKRPFYHVVVIDSRHARDSGNFIERVGYFNPIAKGAEVKLFLDNERVTHWLGKGAQPSEKVSHLIKISQLPDKGAALYEAKKKKLKAKKAAAKKLAAAATETKEESATGTAS